MENEFCDIHGCQLEERKESTGQIGLVCIICEEEGRN